MIDFIWTIEIPHSVDVQEKWLLTAHCTLKKLGLSLRETDQSYIAQGDVSLSHIIHSCSHTCPQNPATVNGTTLWSLWLKGLGKLADVGSWVIDPHGNIVMHLVQLHIDRSWSAAAHQNWNKLFNALHDQLHIEDVLYGPLDLAIPRQVRSWRAENLISSLANVCGFAPSQHANTLIWASDGSMLPSSAWS